MPKSQDLKHNPLSISPLARGRKSAKRLEGVNKIRHSLSHILALAVQELYPKVKFGIGPAIENGFYYDFDRLGVSSLELGEIEKRMREIIKKDLKFTKKIISKTEAKKLFENQPYKLDLINSKLQTPNSKLTIYQVGDFIDLCAGPHIKNTKELGAFKLTKIAGAYWKGDEKNPMLTRIYGLAFETEKELQDYLTQQEQAEKRDHRKLGQKLDLFSFHDESPGMPFWHPKGLIIFNLLIEFWRNLHKKDYQEVQAPIVLSEKLWRQSGHWSHYKEEMFFTKDETQKFALRPMDCPGEILIYKSALRSYKDLPIRFNELGTVFRNERSGTLHGLFRTRQIVQDDAHLFLTEEQIEQEILKIMQLVDKIYGEFKLPYSIKLSTRPKKYMGDIKTWSKAEKALESVLKKNKKEYKLNPGDGAFYGPKIDIDIEDSIGRAWQCATIQLDFQMPGKFDLSYIDKNGKKQTPVMIHRTIMGALGRFIGILLEHYAGALPLWLSPEQIWVIPISSKHEKYAQEIYENLSNPLFNSPLIKGGKQEGYRVKIKDENETVSKKIRGGEIQKIPYLLIVGDKEIQNKTINVRERDKKTQKEITIKEFLRLIAKL